MYGYIKDTMLLFYNNYYTSDNNLKFSAKLIDLYVFMGNYKSWSN